MYFELISDMKWWMFDVNGVFLVFFLSLLKMN